MPYQCSFLFYTLYKESKRAGLTITHQNKRNAREAKREPQGIYLIL